MTMVAALGGPVDLLDNPGKYLAKAPVVRAVHARGVVAAVDACAIGNAIIELGGGRRQVGETLDLSVGFSDIAGIGTELAADTPLALVHAADEADADRAAECLLDAVTTGESTPPERPVIHEILTG